MMYRLDFLENQAKMLAEIAKTPEGCEEIVSKGGIEVLISNLLNPSIANSSIPEYAALILNNIASSDQGAEAIITQGAIPILLNTLATTKHSKTIQIETASILIQVALFEDGCNSIIAMDGIKLFSILLGQPKSAAHLQENIIGILANIALYETGRNAMIRAGIVEQLLYFLEEGIKPSIQKNTAQTFSNIALSDIACLKIIATRGVERLLHLLATAPTDIGVQAVWAIANIAMFKEGKEAIKAAHGIELLLYHLKKEHSDMIRLHAARALANLSESIEACEVMEAEEGIPRLRALSKELAGTKEDKAKEIKNFTDVALKNMNQNKSRIPSWAPWMGESGATSENTLILS